MQIDSPNILTQLIVSGSSTISGSLNVIGTVSAAGLVGNLEGTAESASFVEFSGVGGKPSLVSGSSQVSFTGIVDKPALVSGSSQISFDGIVDKPALVSGSSQIELNQISGNEFISQSYAFPSSVTIRGNLVVSGSTFIEDTQTIQITDNLLVVNSNEQGEGVTSTIAGIQIDRGSATDFQFVFDENSKDFEVGKIGNRQSVATRQTEPTNAGIPFWNENEKRFDNSSNATLNTNGNITAVGFTGSINFNNLENSPTLVSGSSQVSLTDTDGFTEYSGSVSSSLDEKVNTADIINDLTTGGAEAPLSAEQGVELEDTKQANLVSGTNIKTINSESILGSGDLEVGGGKVLQVVRASTTTFATNTTTTYEDSTLTATITPRSATSKIVFTTFQPARVYSLNVFSRAKLRMMRGATQILETQFGIAELPSGATPVIGGAIVLSDEDTPATTSPVTYKTQFACVNGTGFEEIQVQVGVNGLSGFKSTIILMEIEA